MGLGLLSFSEGDSFSRVSGTLKEDPEFGCEGSTAPQKYHLRLNHLEFGCEGSNCPTEVPPPLKII